MNPNLTSVAAWSYGLAAVCYGALALYLGPGSRGGLQRLSLLIAVGLTATWALINLVFVLAQVPALLALSTAVDAMRVGAWYTFLLLPIALPKWGMDRERVPRTTWFVLLAAALVAFGLLASAAIALDGSAFSSPVRWWLFTSLAMTIFGLVLVEQLFRSVPEDERWHIKPLCLGLAGAFVFDLYLFAEALLFNRVEADAWSVRGFVHALVVPLMAVSTIRNRDWTSRITLSRRMVFHSTAVVAVGVYLLFMAAAGYYVRYFGGTWGRALQVAFLFAAVLALVAMAFSGSIRAKLRVIVSKHFFSYRYDYRDEWLRFTRALSARDGRQLGQDVIKGLADMLESPAGVLWLRESSSRHFAQTAAWNMPASAATEPSDSNFVQFLVEKGWVINLEEFRVSPERYRELLLPQWLSELQNAWLIIPLASGSDLIGFVILATARTRIDVNWEVNDLLKTAARQAATFLIQTQATEALLEARKFDAFNRMSAFVVHDLKNIVAQLSLMLKNAERHRDNPEFQQDMLMTVSHSVERMKQLMMQLREGTTPVDAPHGVDLAALIERIRRSKADQRPVLEVQLEEKVLARGHEDRLERVIGHLVQNAIDATSEDGRVWIRLASQDGMAIVEVGDTGHGMTPEFIRERLFKPFQTTKEMGMGIGAYESFQYVQELGGRVQVDSKPGVGTHLSLLLPRVDSPADSAALRQAKVRERDEVARDHK